MNTSLKKNLNTITDTTQLETRNLETQSVLATLKHEQLVNWAMRTWDQRYAGQPYLTVWGSDTCADHRALVGIKSGRKLQSKAHYMGFQPIPCEVATPINRYYRPARKAVMTEGCGAFIFSFKIGTNAYDVLYVATHVVQGDSGLALQAIALVPTEALNAWSAFEALCDRAVYRVVRSEKVYIVGGAEDSFEANVDWDSVILAERVKADLKADLDIFFDKGVDLYKGLNLPPFRKILLVGPPGSGKSMLCAALSKYALSRKCVVIYVSSSDNDGNKFEKIQRALRIVANSKLPVLLVVEELDVYLEEEDKSQILNVLDGFESPNNPKGALLIATTNYPEAIDARIAKRPGRMDRIIKIPALETPALALKMLQHYMGKSFHAELTVAAEQLVGQTGAFVREVALYAQMSALSKGLAQVPLALLNDSIATLTHQVTVGPKMTPDRPFGFKSVVDQQIKHEVVYEPSQNGHEPIIVRD